MISFIQNAYAKHSNFTWSGFKYLRGPFWQQFVNLADYNLLTVSGYCQKSHDRNKITANCYSFFIVGEQNDSSSRVPPFLFSFQARVEQVCSSLSCFITGSSLAVNTCKRKHGDSIDTYCFLLVCFLSIYIKHALSLA